MGKSAVLKDLTNRPAGYVLKSGEAVICRAQLAGPAQLALVLSDGSQITHALDGGKEQRFPCEGKAMCGCYVFRGEELLLISDEAMRRAFEQQMIVHSKRAAEGSAREQETAQPSPQQEPPERAECGEGQHAFAQRRWPPPPCWEGARYLEGRWQEK